MLILTTHSVKRPVMTVVNREKVDTDRYNAVAVSSVLTLSSLQ